MLPKVVGIGGLLCEQHRFRLGVFEIGDLGVERLPGALRVQLTGHHPVPHILRDGKHLGGGQTHIQMVSLDAVLHILQRGGRLNVHFLIIRKHRGAGRHAFLALLAENRQQDLHDSRLFGLVLFHFFGHRQLAHGIGQHPVILRGLAKVGQNHAVDAPFLPDVVRQRGGIADHGGLALIIGLHRFGELQLLIAGLEPDIFQKLLVFPEHLRPDNVVQTHLIFLGLALVLHAPFGPLQAHQLGDGAALHGLQTGIVIVPVGLEALDAHFLKGIDGRHKFRVVGGQRNVVLIKQVLVGHDAVHLGAHGQPADGAAGLPVDLQIAAVKSARHLGLA